MASLCYFSVSKAVDSKYKYNKSSRCCLPRFWLYVYRKNLKILQELYFNQE